MCHSVSGSVYQESTAREFEWVDKDHIPGRGNIQNLNSGLCATDSLLGFHFASQHRWVHVDRTWGRGRMIILLECLPT